MEEEFGELDESESIICDSGVASNDVAKGQRCANVPDVSLAK